MPQRLERKKLDFNGVVNTGSVQRAYPELYAKLCTKHFGVADPSWDDVSPEGFGPFASDILGENVRVVATRDPNLFDDSISFAYKID